MEVTLIELNKITPNEYNPNVVPDDILAKLRAEIGQKGVCVPIIVRRSGDDGYQIVDGYHRWRICQDLGWQEMPCIIADFDEREAPLGFILVCLIQNNEDIKSGEYIAISKEYL